MIHRFVLHNDDIREASERMLSPGQVGLLTGWGVFSTLRVVEGGLSGGGGEKRVAVRPQVVVRELYSALCNRACVCACDRISGHWNGALSISYPTILNVALAIISLGKKVTRTSPGGNGSVKFRSGSKKG